MSTTGDPDRSAPNERGAQETGEDRLTLNWADMDGRHWRIELTPRHVALHGEGGSVELPASKWTNDIYVARHGSGYLVRIETFEIALRFLVPHDQAVPLLAHLGRPGAKVAAADTPDEPIERESPLLWPKVSPLAVWALICSTLVFIPVVGLAFAAVTAVLLTLHRRRVRRAPAWRHSRILCVVAFGFLLSGLFVSSLAMSCMRQPLRSISAIRPVVDAGAQSGPWGPIAAGLVVVLLALTVHEAAHAITAWWLGDGLAHSLGRVSLNPMAHIDPFGTILLPLMLVWAGGPVFGYARPVPVRVELLPRYRRAHILISLAGPGSNLLLAAASLMLLITLGCGVRLAFPEAVVANLSESSYAKPVSVAGFALAPAVAAGCTIFKLSFVINVVLAIFNLIPLPPLDGSWVLEHLFPQSLGRLYAAMRPYGFLVFVGAIYLGLFSLLMIPVAAVLNPGFMLLHRATGM